MSVVHPLLSPRCYVSATALSTVLDPPECVHAVVKRLGRGDPGSELQWRKTSCGYTNSHAEPESSSQASMAARDTAALRGEAEGPSAAKHRRRGTLARSDGSPRSAVLHLLYFRSEPSRSCVSLRREGTKTLQSSSKQQALTGRSVRCLARSLPASGLLQVAADVLQGSMDRTVRSATKSIPGNQWQLQ